MLYGPTFDLIYRHTLALISALFNADLSTRFESLRLTLYLFFPATRASDLSLVLSYGNKIFPDFQLQIQVQEDL